MVNSSRKRSNPSQKPGFSIAAATPPVRSVGNFDVGMVNSSRKRLSPDTMAFMRVTTPFVLITIRAASVDSTMSSRSRRACLYAASASTYVSCTKSLACLLIRVAIESGRFATIRRRSANSAWFPNSSSFGTSALAMARSAIAGFVESLPSCNWTTTMRFRSACSTIPAAMASSSGGAPSARTRTMIARLSVASWRLSFRMSLAILAGSAVW